MRILIFQTTVRKTPGGLFVKKFIKRFRVGLHLSFYVKKKINRKRQPKERRKKN